MKNPLAIAVQIRKRPMKMAHGGEVDMKETIADYIRKKRAHEIAGSMLERKYSDGGMVEQPDENLDDDFLSAEAQSSFEVDPKKKLRDRLSKIMGR